MPFLNRYLFNPLNLRWPHFNFEIGSDLASEIISILSLLFAVYILGHLLAYMSSQIIEKLCDRILGKISTSILLSARKRPASRNEAIRKKILSNIKGIQRDKAIFPTLVRSLFHVPYVPAYLFIYYAGIFGYYNTRLTSATITLVKKKFDYLDLERIKISTNSKWFKPLEYYVINQCPMAVNRMYNYLIISGLFRTLSIIFMFASWMQIYYIAHFLSDKHLLISPFLGSTNPKNMLYELVITVIAYSFCLFSYIKFQRRYIEEAIFSFAFDKPYDIPDTEPTIRAV